MPADVIGYNYRRVIGERLGNFEIVGRLGRGGMGEVWLAEQLEIGTKVAIKMLRRDISEDTEQVRRFFNEARAVGTIRHAGIVKIFDVGFHAEQAYLVMEYLEGETLGRRIRRLGRLPAGMVADVGRQIAGVLDATHAAGVTHRDLKPDNVFIVADLEQPSRERVKVLDFGIAKLTGALASTGSPQTTGTLGTPQYMAPEQWSDAANVDWRADAYSLGCVAFEMACARPPFVVASYAEACSKHLHEVPVRARTIAGELPVGLDDLIARLLAKQPRDRGASMTAIGRAFAAHSSYEWSGERASGDASAADVALAPTHADGERRRKTFGGTTVDTTISGGAAEVGPPPPSPATRRPRSMRGLAIGGAIAAAGIAGAVVATIALTGDEPRPAAVSTIADASTAIEPLPPPPPPPPTVDAATANDATTIAVVVPADAARSRRPLRSPPRQPAIDEADPPDYLEPHRSAPTTRQIRKRITKQCTGWTDDDGYIASYRVTGKGVVEDLVVNGPDATVIACMTRVIQRATFPVSKFGMEFSSGIVRE